MTCGKWLVLSRKGGLGRGSRALYSGWVGWPQCESVAHRTNVTLENKKSLGIKVL